MKKIFLRSMWCAVAAMLFTSCNVMDFDPSDRWSPTTIFSSETTVDSYVTGFYGIFRDNAEIYNTPVGTENHKIPWLSDAYSDLLKSTSWSQYNHPFNKTLTEPGFISNATAGGFECWNTHYERIKRQNEFFRDAPVYGAKFDVVKGNDSSAPTWLDERLAEVRFCRAYTYYLLCRVYGGVVIRTEANGVDGPDQNNKARSTEEASWNFIIQELQAAAEDLPDVWDTANTGRATKKSAYALLSRVALFAKKWDIAAQAARDTKTAGGALLGNYSAVFTQGVNNPEICFGVDFIAKVIGTQYDRYIRPASDYPTATPYATFVPTSELADEYEMADGTPFSWTTNGTDPYTGRDPRFYATILYNGAPWNGDNIESFHGGKDGRIDFVEGSGSIVGRTVTGYYLRKYLRDTGGNATWVEQEGTTHYWSTVRYAEVLLNKAEALAESDFNANKTEALAALNEVRGRQSVNLPDRTASTKEEFMEYLRHERIVELAGEGFRYWDLRRWKLANGDNGFIDGKSGHGVEITRSATQPYTYTYQQVDIDAGKTRIFEERYYAFSIPLEERSRNPLIGENNPGW